MTFSFLILEADQNQINNIDNTINLLNFEASILVANSIQDAFEKASVTAIDIFIVDIDFTGNRAGAEFIREIRHFYPLSPIILTGSSIDADEIVMAFSEFKLLGYADKPLNTRVLKIDILKALDYAKLINNRTVTFRRQNYSGTFNTKDIYCIQRMPNGKKKILVTAYDDELKKVAKTEFSIKSSLAEVLELFENDQDVIRCHQSWIINPRFIRGYDVTKEQLILAENIKVPLGETYKQNVALFI